MVRAEGLEPPHLSTTGPKPAASTNSATRARSIEGAAYSKDARWGKPLKHQKQAPDECVEAGKEHFDARYPDARTASGPEPAAGDARSRAAAATRPAEHRAARGTPACPRHRRPITDDARNRAADDADLAGRLMASAPPVPMPAPLPGEPEEPPPPDPV